MVIAFHTVRDVLPSEGPYGLPPYSIKNVGSQRRDAGVGFPGFLVLGTAKFDWIGESTSVLHP